jgi:mannose-6-phosphate isomerase-like protein (cupin superfamily)
MDGLAAARVVRPVGAPPPVTTTHSAEFVFTFVLDGTLTLRRGEDEPLHLNEGDSFVVPAHTPYTLSDPSADLQLLDVTLPAEI